MRYPIITSADATTLLAMRRAEGAVDSERFLRRRGFGSDMDEDFVNGLRTDLAAVKADYPDGLKNPHDANVFEGDAARIVHEGLPRYPEVVADPEFWIWLAVTQISDTVEWRYGHPAGGTALANYGIGARTENLLYRLWLRAELVFDERARDPYHLCKAGQIDFYRSHLFRQGYANSSSFARALLRYQYPSDDRDEPRLKVNQIRELVKRLRRLRANLFIELLNEDQCRSVIEMEAAMIGRS